MARSVENAAAAKAIVDPLIDSSGAKGEEADKHVQEAEDLAKKVLAGCSKCAEIIVKGRPEMDKIASVKEEALDICSKMQPQIRVATKLATEVLRSVQEYRSTNPAAMAAPKASSFVPAGLIAGSGPKVGALNLAGPPMTMPSFMTLPLMGNLGNLGNHLAVSLAALNAAQKPLCLPKGAASPLVPPDVLAAASTLLTETSLSGTPPLKAAGPVAPSVVRGGPIAPGIILPSSGLVPPGLVSLGIAPSGHTVGFAKASPVLNAGSVEP